MIFIHKLHNFPSTLPTSVKNTISAHAPSPDLTADYSSDWYTTYNSKPYNSSSFFKGPLLYKNIMTDNPQLYINTSLNCYKQRIKSYILEVQCHGDKQNWENGNFKLLNLPGLRSSSRVAN